MESKSRRIYRSSSGGDFLNTSVRPIESPVPVAMWPAKRRPIDSQLDAKKGSSTAGKGMNIEKLNVSVTVAKQPPRKSIFTLESSAVVKEKNNDDDDVEKRHQQHGAFFEVCALCKKKIEEDVYMYDYLQAFCSPECRDKQIAVDEKLRPPSSEPRATTTKSVASSVKPGFGTQVNKRIEISKFK